MDLVAPASVAIINAMSARPAIAAPCPSSSVNSDTPSSLVLMVGAGVRLEARAVAEMASAGLRCLWLGDAAQALAACRHARFDAAVWFVAQPMAVVARQFAQWQKILRCPLIVVADRADDIDEIMALEMGADAYLALPLPSRRLRAHVLARLRQADGFAAVAVDAPNNATNATNAGNANIPNNATSAPPQSSMGGWTLDRVHNHLHNAQRKVVLTEVLASLLHSLMHDLGRVVPRARLLAGLAPKRRPVETLDARSIDRYVARLRQRLHEQQVDALHITNVRGRGYMLTVLEPSHSLTLHNGAVLRLFPEAEVMDPRLSAAH